LFHSVAHFFIGSLILGEFNFLSSLYILVISPLSDVQLANIFLAPLVEEAVFSLSYVLGSFVKNWVAIASWICAWVFYSVSLVFMSAFFHYHAAFIHMAI
jgi:hypothetical protein